MLSASHDVIQSIQLLHDISRLNSIPRCSELHGNNIAIFGLSANPPTGYTGHIGIIKYLHDSGIFDEIWILPVYLHIFNAKRCMESYVHRLNMLQLCVDAIVHDDIGITSDTTIIKHQCKLRVLKLEKAASDYYHILNGDKFCVGTIDVLDYINMYYTSDISSYATDHPSGNHNDVSNTKTSIAADEAVAPLPLKLNLILGMDTFIDFCSMKWKNADRIATIVKSMHVIDRRGILRPDDTTSTPINSDISTVIASKVHYHSLDFLSDVSSSLVRNLIVESISTKTNEKDDDVNEDTVVRRLQQPKIALIEELQYYLHDDIINYIISNHLYGIS